MTQSRTQKSIRNSTVALIMYFINLVLQFFSRKIFLDHLGTEVLGLNTTAGNLLQFLNLAELGIGAAIGFTLYKPLYENDKDAINEILTLQGWYYKRIASIVILGAIVLMCFFPLIFEKIQLPLWYAYASFLVLLLSALLSYYFNYKQVLLSADQQDYKIQYSYRGVMLTKILCQIVAVKCFPNPYVWWLILEGLFAIIACVSLNRTIQKTYPYLNKVLTPIKELKETHHTLVTKIGQVFYHKIGGFALTQTSPLIIYAYANLSLVAVYGNYQIIVVALTSLMAALFNSIGGGIGNLVASGDKQRVLRVFNELYSIRFLLISTICVGFYLLSPMIITIWIGREYLLPSGTVIIIIVNMFFLLNRSTVDNFIAANGLYGDVYSPLVEAILNIGLSVLFGYFWGLNGILIGVAISLFGVIFCWKPYYLFTRGFLAPLKTYIALISKNIFGAIVGLITVISLRQMIFKNSSNIVVDLLINTALVAIYMITCFGCQYLSKCGINLFIMRFKDRFIRK